MDKYKIFAKYFSVTADNVETINKNYDLLETIINSDNVIKVPDDIKNLVFDIYKSKGNFYHKSLELDKAIVCLKKAIEIGNQENKINDCCDIYYLIGCCHEARKDYENMLKYYGLYVKSYNFEDLTDELFDVIEKMGKFAKEYNVDVMEYYIIGANNNNWNMCQQLINHYKATDDRDMVIKYSIKLIDYGNFFEPINLGNYYKKLGDPENALKYYLMFLNNSHNTSFDDYLGVYDYAKNTIETIISIYGFNDNGEEIYLDFMNKCIEHGLFYSCHRLIDYLCMNKSDNEKDIKFIAKVMIMSNKIFNFKYKNIHLNSEKLILIFYEYAIHNKIDFRMCGQISKFIKKICDYKNFVSKYSKELRCVNESMYKFNSEYICKNFDVVGIIINNYEDVLFKFG